MRSTPCSTRFDRLDRRVSVALLLAAIVGRFGLAPATPAMHDPAFGNRGSLPVIRFIMTYDGLLD